MRRVIIKKADLNEERDLVPVDVLVRDFICPAMVSASKSP
jgi:hypothetical protein